MKKLLSILIMLLPVFVMGQNEPADTFSINVPTGPSGQTTPMLLHIPSTYGSETNSYPVILFFHGLGESGTPLSNLYNNADKGGPCYYIAHGQWPTSFYDWKSNANYKFIVATPVLSASAGVSSSGSISAWQADFIIDYLYSHYRCDTTRLYFIGLSAGGQGILNYAGNVHTNETDHGALGSPIPIRHHLSAFEGMSCEFAGSFAKIIGDTIYAKKIGFLPVGSPGDSHADNTFNVNFYASQDSGADYGYRGTLSSTLYYGWPYSGGHCCWGPFTNPTNTIAWGGHTMNAMQYLLQSQSVGTPPSGNIPPSANAGSNQTIYISKKDTTILSGSGMANSPATSVAYLWTKVSGPGIQTISGNTTTTPIIRGLQVGAYAFQLKVTDNNGLFSTSTANVTANAGCGGANIMQTAGTDSGRTLVPSVAAGYNPGDTIRIPSNRQYTYWSADGLHGTQACPITIINDTGQVVMYAGIAVTNSTYVHITGTGNTKYFYGFYITSYPGKPTAQRGNSLQADGRSAWIEIDHVDEYIKTYGLWAKNEQSCQDSINNWRLHDFKIHDIRGRNINQDWIYGLSTAPSGVGRTINCSSANYSPAPSHGANFEVYNMIGDSIGRTGIQLSGADSGANSIHDCTINGTGYENNPQQGSGIILGGLTTARVYNNHIRNTYQHGISVLGAGVCELDHNDIDSSGMLRFPGVDTVTLNPGYTAISVDTRGTTTAWPNTVSNGAGAPLTPSTHAAIPLTILVHDNKVGVNDQFDNTIHDYYQIRIGAGFQSAQPWTANSLVYNNVKQNGVTPAVFGVNPQITFSTNGTQQPPCNCLQMKIRINFPH